MGRLYIVDGTFVYCWWDVCILLMGRLYIVDGMFVYCWWDVCILLMGCLYIVDGMFVYCWWDVCILLMGCLYIVEGTFVYVHSIKVCIVDTYTYHGHLVWAGIQYNDIHLSSNLVNCAYMGSSTWLIAPPRLINVWQQFVQCIYTKRTCFLVIHSVWCRPKWVVLYLPWPIFK